MSSINSGGSSVRVAVRALQTAWFDRRAVCRERAGAVHQLGASRETV